MQMYLKKCFQTSLEILNKIDKLASLKMAILDDFISWKEKKKIKEIFLLYIYHKFNSFWVFCGAFNTSVNNIRLR